MSDDHHHPHGPDCNHGNPLYFDEKGQPLDVPVLGEYPRSMQGFWNKARDDAYSIFKDGINRNKKPEAHDGHFHINNKVTDIEKLGLLAGATVSLGVALHGVRNVVRGVRGWEDKELDEQHKPSLQYTVIGAAETVGGLALVKRLLTGSWKAF